MIQITFVYGDSCEITVDGHAGYNPGNDIVCSAVSMLMQTLQHWLDSCDRTAGTSAESGKMFVSSCNPAFRPYFAFVQCGLQSLAHRYPDHVRVHVRED